MKNYRSTEGILVHKIPFQDSSWIITWLTAEEGRIKTMVKGATKPGSPFYGVLDLYYQCDLQYTQKTRSEIDLLREVQLQQPFLNLRRDYTIIQVIHYFYELIDLVTELRTPIPEFYDLFQKALRYLNEKELSPQLIERYEKKILELSGIPIQPQRSLAQSLQSAGFKTPKTKPFWTTSL